MSDKAKFGLFSRTVAPLISKAGTLISFMEHNKWAKVILLSADSPAHFQNCIELEKKMRNATTFSQSDEGQTVEMIKDGKVRFNGVTRAVKWDKPKPADGSATIGSVEATRTGKVVLELRTGTTAEFENPLAIKEIYRPQAFEHWDYRRDKTIYRDKLRQTLTLIKRHGTRIVVLVAFEEDEKNVAEIAEHEKMMRGWAWLSSQERDRDEHMLGWIFVRPLLPSKGMQDFKQQVSHYTESRFNITVSPDEVDLTYSIALHNAIMLYAHAATKVLSEGGDLSDGTAVTAAVRTTTFEGVGGITVALDEKGDRIESYEVMNYVVDANGDLDRVPVGVYGGSNSTEQQYRVYERAVVWPGGTTEVPADYVPEGDSC